MKRHICVFAFFVVAITVNPVAPQTRIAAGGLQAFGLQGQRVMALDISPQLAGYLYAATDSDGVYRRELFQVDSSWRSLGLAGKKLTALDIQVWGAGPAILHAPIVGVEPDRNNGDSTLIYRLEKSGWIAADSGLARSDIFNLKALASFESGGHMPPGLAFAGGSGLIYRSTTFVTHQWSAVFNMGVAVTNVIETYPKFFGNEVWAGGETAIFAPWIARSTDEGVTWEVFYPDLSGDNACNSLAIHPDEANIVYAGMEGAVIKTTDGGKSWNLTGLHQTPVYFYGLALDPFNPNHLYAGGTIASPNRWALWESFDAGVKWQEIPAPVSITAAGNGITSLVADPTLPGVVYIATRGDGVWRYQSEVTAVQEPRETKLPASFRLEQNYPNPFSTAGIASATSGGNAGTIIRFEIPANLANVSAHLAIYNLRGELVRELLNTRLPAGKHFARWEGKDNTGREVAAGIYLYRLQAGNVVEMRKLSYLK